MNNNNTGGSLQPQNVNTTDAGSEINQFGNVGTSINTAPSKTVEQAHSMSLDSALLGAGHSGIRTTLEEYLQRPIRVRSGLLSSTDIGTTFTKDKVIQTLSATSYMLDKLDGNFMYRADVRYRLQVNASRFQQGRYILAWIPSGGDKAMPTTDAFNLFHAATIQQVVQLPHVEIDIACDTECELLIPYTAFFNASLVRNTSMMDIGTIFMYPYMALTAATGALVADYTLWANFENVKLYGTAQSQSGIKMKKGKAPAEAELKSQMKGPITTVLSGISNFAGTIASIPMLTSVASPVSWVTSILAQTADSFGWSKPNDESAAMRVVRNPQPFCSNVDVVDPGLKLSMLIKNKISVLPGFAGTDIDEMSFDYFKSIPGLYAISSWPTSAVVGDLLTTIPMCPNSWGATTSSVNQGAVTNFVPVAHLARAFSFYRGSVVITVKIVKTEFHSGRIMAAFIPVDNRFYATVPSLTMANNHFYSREIMDVRHGNEFTFTIPFVCPETWMLLTKPFGYFQVMVVDPLIAPATVSSTVSLIFEISGGDDFEVAVPSGAKENYAPICLAAFQSGIQNQKSSDEPCMVADLVLGGGSTSTTAEAIAPSFTTIGEKIVSLRQLLKRFCPIVMNVTTASNRWLRNDTAALGFVVTNLIDVYYDATGANATYAADPVSYFGSCYGLFRGSIRWRMTFIGDTTSAGSIYATQGTASTAATYVGIAVPDPTTTVIALPATLYNNSALGQVASNGGIEVTNPYYSGNHSTPVRGMLICGALSEVSGNSLSGLAPTEPESPDVNVRFQYSAANQNYLLQRALGEDASFGRFISTPWLKGSLLT